MILETSRLQLRKMHAEDRHHIYEMLSDPIVMTYYPQTLTQRQCDEWMARNYRRYEEVGTGMWAVIRKTDQAFVGVCGLIPQEVDNAEEMEIGYLLLRNFWKQGYATEAAAGCREYARNMLRLKRVISLIDPANLPSRKVAERIGMQLDKLTVKWNKEICVYSLCLEPHRGSENETKTEI